jgi:UDP-N-acetylmuramoyl-tripeptide--D-alanyl-D-alanine ligase
MTKPLWTMNEIVAATGALTDGAGDVGWVNPGHLGPGATQQGSGGSSSVGSRKSLTQPTDAPSISGISIDTRSLVPGDLFVALKDIRDGHEFVTTAFKNGAAAALVARNYVRQPGDGVLIRADDPLRAMEDLGRAARARLAPDASVIAVTGSVGKTTTKEMLRACLAPLGLTHAADKSFNNHWGVPLTLARMPAGTRYGVFEIGMNHAGEIAPLTAMVRPHVAIVTTVEAVHLENFDSVEGIAHAKAEIFAGLDEGGTAVIPADNPHILILERAAVLAGAVVDRFGRGASAHTRLVAVTDSTAGQDIRADLGRRPVTFRLGAPGAHMVDNALAVAAALVGAGLDPQSALAPLAAFGAPQGRGSRTQLATAAGPATLIDESYNANPASMRAAITTAAGARTSQGRLIVVLGDMLELGPEAAALHAGLAPALAAVNVDLVFACGPHMRHLYDALPETNRAKWAKTSLELQTALLDTVRGGDVVMIKGSNGSNMAPLVKSLIARHTPATSRG